MINLEADRLQEFKHNFGDQPELHQRPLREEPKMIGPRVDGSATLIERTAWKTLIVRDFIPYHLRYIKRTAVMGDTAANLQAVTENDQIGELQGGALEYPTDPHVRTLVELKRVIGSDAQWSVDIGMYVIPKNVRYYLTTLSYTEDHLTPDEIESGMLRLSRGHVVSGLGLQDIYREYDRQTDKGVGFDLVFHYSKDGSINANVFHEYIPLGKKAQGEDFSYEGRRTDVCFTPTAPDRLRIIKRSNSLDEGAKWIVDAPIPLNLNQLRSESILRAHYSDLPNVVRQIIP